MGTNPYIFAPIPVEVIQKMAREQAQRLNEGRYAVYNSQEEVVFCPKKSSKRK